MKAVGKGLILAGIPLLFHLSICALLSNQLSGEHADLAAETKLRAKLQLADRTNRQWALATCAIFMWHATKLPQFQSQAKKSILQMNDSVNKLLQLADNREASIIRADVPKMNALLAIGDRLSVSISQNTFPLRSDEDVPHYCLTRMDQPLSQFLSIEGQALNAAVKARQIRVSQIENIAKYGFAGMCTLSLLLLCFFVGDIRNRLKNIMQNSCNIATKRPLLNPLQGRDEIAELDRRVHDCGNRLINTEQTRDRLVAVVGHELRTPLTTIDLLLNLVVDGAVGHISESALATARKAKRQCGRLVEQLGELLYFERLSSGRVQLSPEMTNLSDVAEVCAETLAAQEQYSGVHISFSGFAGEVLIDVDAIVRMIVAMVQELCSGMNNVDRIMVSASLGKESLELIAVVQDPPQCKGGSSEENSTAVDDDLSLWLLQALLQRHNGTCKRAATRMELFLPLLPPNPKVAVKRADLELPRYGLLLKGLTLVLIPMTFSMCALSSFATISEKMKEETTKQLKVLELQLLASQCEEQKWERLGVAALMSVYPHSRELENRYQQNKSRLEALQDKLRICAAPVGYQSFASDYIMVNDHVIELGETLASSGVKDIFRTLASLKDLRNLITERGYKIDSPWTCVDVVLDKAFAPNNTTTAMLRQSEALRSLVNLSSVFALAVAFLTLWLFHRSIASRLRSVSCNADKLLAGEKLETPVKGNDELAVIDRFFFDSGQQFLAVRRLKQHLASLARTQCMGPCKSIAEALTELLQQPEEGVSQDVADRVRRSQNEVARLQRLIDDLLSLDDTTYSTEKMKFGATSLDAILQAATDAVEALSKRHQVQLIKPSATNLSIFVDSDRIVQVLINLLSNAIKFSPPGSSVELEAMIRERIIELSVTDHGRGIPSESLATIFDPFSQVTASDGSAKVGGSGLGLYIANSIARAHNGNLEVKSIPEKGTTFTLSLPAEEISRFN